MSDNYLVTKVVFRCSSMLQLNPEKFDRTRSRISPRLCVLSNVGEMRVRAFCLIQLIKRSDLVEEVVSKSHK